MSFLLFFGNLSPKRQTRVQTMRIRRFLLPLFAASFASAAEPVITVSPYDHRHVYETGATGFTWYWGHLNAADNEAQVFSWLFQDLNIDYIRTGLDEAETSNDNSDPLSIDWNDFDFDARDTGNEWVYNRAKPLNPRLKTMTYAHQFPDWMRNGNGTPNYSVPNLYAEYAEWLFANLVEKKAAGAPVDVLDIANEPDYHQFGQGNLANIIENVVPLLRAWVDDPARNTYGVTMPKIMAPSGLSASISKDWVEDWATDAGVWDNIDIIGTHQYSNGFVSSNYATVNGLRGGRPYMQSEMHCGHSSVLNNSNQLPEDWVEDELEAALLLGRLFSKSVYNGVSVYDYYQGVSPQDSPTSLVHTPYNAMATRRKVYFAFKQLSSMQTRGSHVVKSQIAGGVSGYDAIAYHSWGEQKTWITATCSEDTGQSILLELLDPAGARLPIRSVRIYETSATRDAELIADETLVPGRTQYRAQLPAHSLRTFEISWDGTNRLVATDDWENGDMGGGVSGGTGWSGGWLRTGSPLPIGQNYNKNIAPRFRGNGSGEASIRRVLATPLVGAGVIRFKRDADGLDAGESVKLEVYDGAWHEVWQLTEAQNGTDADGSADDMFQSNVPLSGFGPITEIRFRFLADNSADYFHLDDLEVVETAVGSTGLVWQGDGTTNRWAADATPNWLSGSSATGFSNGVAVLFNDSGENAPVIELSGALAPAGIGVDASEDYTFGGAGSITGACALDKRGSGKLTLTAANSFTGGTAHKQGTLQINHAGALGSGPLAVTTTDPGLNPNTRVQLVSGLTLASAITIGATSPGTGQGTLGIVSGSATYAGAVSITGDTSSGGHIKGPLSGGVLYFTGPLTKAGSASRIVIRDGFVRLAGGGNYNALAIGAGTTSLGAHNGAATNATISLGASGSATFDLNGWNQTLAGLQREANTPTVTNSAATLSTLTMNPGAVTQAFDGSIAGNLKLRISAGIFELGGVNTFTGGVELTGGTLRVNGQISQSGVIATNGSWLGGSGTVAGATAMYAGTTLSAGPAAIGTMRFGSSLALVGAAFKAEIDSSAQTADLAIVSGAVTLTSNASLQLVDLATTAVALPEGAKIAIIEYTGASLSGTFAGLPAATTIASGPNRFIINYADTTDGEGATGKFITLTSVGPVVSYAEWSAAMNIGAQPMSADADSDGEMNLMEFSTAQNPHASTRATPALAKSGANLEFTYTRANAAQADGVTFTVEWRDSLTSGAWSSAGVTEQILSDNGTVQTVKATVAAGTGSRFMRLRVVK